MKTRLVFVATALTFSIAAQADDHDEIAKLRGDILVSETIRDADKALLGEALLKLGRAAITEPPMPSQSHEKISRFIKDKIEGLLDQEAGIQKKRLALEDMEEKDANRGLASMEILRDASVRQKETEELIQRLEEAEVDLELLQLQVEKIRHQLDGTMGSLVEIEDLGDDDPRKQARLDEGRKRYEKVRSEYVDLRKRIVMKQRETAGLRMELEQSP